MQIRSANAGFMDLNKASAAINAIPLVKESIPELMQLANGKVPGIPGYLALAKLQQIQQLVQDLGTKQPPQGTIKDNIEQSMSTMMTQQGQQQQAQQQQMPPGGIASLNRVPPNTPQPQMQPEAEPQQEAEQPVEAAHGGIMNAHVDPRMFNFDGGGIVSFAKGLTVTDEEKEKLRNQTKMYIEAAQQKAVEDEKQRAAKERDEISRNAENFNETVGMGEPPARPSLAGGIRAISNAIARPLPRSMANADSGDANDPSFSAVSPLVPPPAPRAPPQPAPRPAPAPVPTVGPLAGSPAKPAGVPTEGPLAGGPAPQINKDDAVVALANKLTLANPDAAQAKIDREAAIPADFDQAKAIKNRQERNVALGIGTYGKNRRAQLDQMKKEFEASQPTSMDRVLASLGAFSRPGARAGDASDASYKMIEAERAARFEFAKAQDAANDAIEKIDEAVRTGDVAAITAAEAEATKAKQTALEKKAELSQKVADNTSAAQRTSISAAAQITDARNRDEALRSIAEKNNVSQEKVAGINYAAHKYTADKPDAGERALRAYIDVKNKNGEAAADAFLNDTEKVRAAVMGYKYTGPDKGVQDEAKILAEIRARTDIIDRKLQNAKLPQAERDALMQQRRIIEKEIRSSPGFGGVQINDPFKK